VARWVEGARPRTLPAAIVPVVVGTMAIRPAPILFGRMALAGIVALALQVGTNFANDYSDGVRGTDAARVGPIRLVGQGLARASTVRAAALGCFALAGAAGLVLCALSSWWLLVPGIAAVAAGWLYTGGPSPYGYLGLGELFVFVFFGLFATVGSAYVQHRSVSALGWVSAIPVGLLATALLEANNLRDLVGDAEASKRTLAVRLGRRRAGWLYVGSMIGVAAGIALAASWRPTALISLAGLGLVVAPCRLALSRASGRELLVMLKATGRAQLVVGLLLALGLAIT
jgi:1,4-dihydroxy-2-naphthoate octaprenyltransferase